MGILSLNLVAMLYKFDDVLGIMLPLFVRNATFSTWSTCAV